MVKVAIIQARLSSKRLPGKVMKELNGKILLERVIDQVRVSKQIDDIWVATSTETEDDVIELFCNRMNIKVYRGSLNNVLQRFCDVIEVSGADIVIRVTADNPLTESSFIDEGIASFLSGSYDYLYFDNVPYGSAVEIVKSDALLTSSRMTKDEYDLEHVTPFIKKNNDLFKIKKSNPQNEKLLRPDIHVSIDTLDDYVRMYKVFSVLQPKNECISLEDVISFLDNKFDL